ncbi:BTAD domain-containing putative transcriptional regulator [Hamadaea sp. NPDC051192]|uniref:AfsR/SARP family transcriptional regulator n=1 Tax=Hamadaea sp. NPDC051192 TaxID=3154940 RepID=UPI00342D2917
MIGFRVLGGITAERDGAEVEVGGAMVRQLLAVLLAAANRVVPRDKLIDALWEGSPPAAARKTLHGYVMRLRKAIGEPERLQWTAGGYRLTVGAGELDADRFSSLISRGKQAWAQRELSAAAADFTAALQLWRGDPFPDVPAAGVAEEVLALQELRLTAIEGQAEIGLDLHRAAEVAASLVPLAPAFPYRERLQEFLMLALFQAGRPAEALEAYRRLHRQLADELGVAPGARLQQLHEEMLRGSPDLVAAASSPPVRTTVPRRLPASVAGFVGRSAELARLRELLPDEDESAIVVISGTAGIGKTALAVRWAHQVAAQFPGGALYVNLRGYDPREPMRPGEALAQLLRACDVQELRIPADEEEAAALFRAVIGAEPTLILLDNARSADQVRPLLPGGGGHLLLVTSRDLLGGLMARDGARRILLDTLSRSEALDLMRYILGDRVDVESHAATDLVAACGNLPLAVRVAAANLAKRPRQTIADQLSRMPPADRLDALAVDGDSQSTVSAVFELSYQHLTDGQREVFRILGLIPGPDTGAEAIAATAGLSVADASVVLGQLADVCLVTEHAAGRYNTHDLIKEYAARLARDPRHHAAAEVALKRYYDWLLGRAYALEAALGGAPRRPDDRDSFESTGDAIAFADAERQNLLAAVESAAALGHAASAWRLTYAVSDYYVIRMAPVDLVKMGEASLSAAVAAGDKQGQAMAEMVLGQAHNLAERPTVALPHLEQAQELAESVGAVEVALAALNGKTNAKLFLGDLPGYVDAAATVAALAARLGRPVTRYVGKQGLGCMLLGRLTEASAFLEQAADADPDYSRHGRAITLLNLGEAYTGQGRHDDAEQVFDEAIQCFESVGGHHYLGIAQVGLSHVLRETGRYAEAAEQLRRAETVLGETVEIQSKAQLRYAQAMLLRATGRPQESLALAMGTLAEARTVRIAHPLVQLLIVAALACHDLREADRGLRFADEAHELAAKHEYALLDGMALAAVAVLSAARGDVATAVVAAQQAEETHRRCGHPQGVRIARSILDRVRPRPSMVAEY